MKRVFFILNVLMLSGYSIGFAQGSGNLVETNRVNSGGNNRPNQIMTLKKDYSDVKAKGSPYLKEAYSKGIVYINGAPNNEAFLRYNAHEDYLEVKEGNGVYQLLRRDYIWAEFDGYTFGVLEYEEDGQLRTGYLLPLAEGAISFYMKPGKRLIKAKEPKSGFEEYVPPRYVDDYHYYLKKGEEPIAEIRLNNRFLKDLFGTDYKKVMDHAKDQHLNGKEPEDLAVLIDWYNNL